MIKRNIVGSSIRTLRSKKDITQLELSKSLRKQGLTISRSTLAKIEAEIRKISEYELYFIAKVLDEDLKNFFPANPKSAVSKLTIERS